MNAKPPIIRLEDTQDYRFKTGSFTVSENFTNSLIKQAIPKIENTITCYGIDTIEIIGHTDGRPGAAGGNIDITLADGFKTKDMSQIIPGSRCVPRSWLLAH